MRSRPATTSKEKEGLMMNIRRQSDIFTAKIKSQIQAAQTRAADNKYLMEKLCIEDPDAVHVLEQRMGREQRILFRAAIGGYVSRASDSINKVFKRTWLEEAEERTFDSRLNGIKYYLSLEFPALLADIYRRRFNVTDWDSANPEFLVNINAMFGENSEWTNQGRMEGDYGCSVYADPLIASINHVISWRRIFNSNRVSDWANAMTQIIDLMMTDEIREKYNARRSRFMTDYFDFLHGTVTRLYGIETQSLSRSSLASLREEHLDIIRGEMAPKGKKEKKKPEPGTKAPLAVLAKPTPCAMSPEEFIDACMAENGSSFGDSLYAYRCVQKTNKTHSEGRNKKGSESHSAAVAAENKPAVLDDGELGPIECIIYSDVLLKCVTAHTLHELYRWVQSNFSLEDVPAYAVRQSSQWIWMMKNWPLPVS